jgi:hypothetical protein
MASTDYIVGKPFEINQDVLDSIINTITIDIAEEKGLPKEDVEHEAYKKLADYYFYVTKKHFNSLQSIGAGVDEFLNSDWLKGMNDLIESLDKQSEQLENERKQTE